MNQLEMDLKQMLSARAQGAGDLPEMHRTVRRARVRRVANAGAGMLAVAALATVSVAGVRAFTSPETVRPVVVGEGSTTEGAYGFESTEGRYPVVAHGTFQGSDWEITAESTARGEMPTVQVQLSVTTDEGTVTEDFEVLPSDDVLMIDHVEGVAGLGADVIFGASIPGIESIEIDVADGEGTRIQPHRFVDYDSQSEMTVDYYIGFVPEGARGFVHARNELGIDMESEAFGDVRLAPHVFTGGRVVVDGEPSGVAWNLEFAGLQKDRACLVLSTGTADPTSECFTQRDIQSAGPLHFVTFEHDDITLVAALISGEVDNASLTLDGGEPATLPWFQPADEDLEDWPVRIVAVGVEPGSHGVLQALSGDGVVLEEEGF